MSRRRPDAWRYGITEYLRLTSPLTERLTIAAKGGAKVLALIGGMLAGADSIDDMDLLRHGGMGRSSMVCGRGRRWGRSCGASPSVTSANSTPPPLGTDPSRRGDPDPGRRRAGHVLDIDDTLRQTYGYAKQGSGRGYTGVKGLNELLATLSTPPSAPVIAATRLRKGSTNSVRGAAKLLADAIAAARRAGASGLLIVRATRPTTATTSSPPPVGARFSVTARQTATVTRAITAIPANGWTAIRYPNAIRRGRAAVGLRRRGREVAFTAFTGRAARPTTSPPG